MFEDVLDHVPGGLDLKAKLNATTRAQLLQAMPSLKERAKTLIELIDGSYFIFADRPLEIEPKAAAMLTPENHELIGRFRLALEAVAPWTSETTEAAMRAFAEQNNLKLGAVAQPLPRDGTTKGLRFGTLYAPPDGPTYHQHFNTASVPSRYFVMSYGGARHFVSNARKTSYENMDKSVKDGGNQIEYQDEDPRILEMYERECARSCRRRCASPCVRGSASAGPPTTTRATSPWRWCATTVTWPDGPERWAPSSSGSPARA